MTEHTSEPWVTKGGVDGVVRGETPWSYEPGIGHVYRILDADGNNILDTVKDDTNHEGRARRVVACVNACEGIPTEILEEIAKQDDAERVWRLAEEVENAP